MSIYRVPVDMELEEEVSPEIEHLAKMIRESAHQRLKDAVVKAAKVLHEDRTTDHLTKLDMCVRVLNRFEQEVGAKS